MGKAEETMDVCLLAGKLLLIYGAETYRVEETMERMARSVHMEQVHSFVTTTGIFLSFQSPDEIDYMQMISVDDRFQDLNKVTAVNQVSREFVSGSIGLEETLQRLEEVSKAKMNYPIWLIYVASGVGGSAFSYLIGGSVVDMLPAFIGGIVTTIVLVIVQEYLKVKFFSEFVAAFVGGLLALFSIQIGIGFNLDQIVIGTLIPLVPGIPLTNSVRDLLAGDLLAGMARGAEAAITSLAIAAGVAVSVSIFIAT